MHLIRTGEAAELIRYISTVLEASRKLIGESRAMLTASADLRPHTFEAIDRSHKILAEARRRSTESAALREAAKVTVAESKEARLRSLLMMLRLRAWRKAKSA